MHQCQIQGKKARTNEANIRGKIFKSDLDILEFSEIRQIIIKRAYNYTLVCSTVPLKSCSSGDSIRPRFCIAEIVFNRFYNIINFI